MTLFFLKSLAEATFPFIHIACCHRGTSDMSFSSPHKFSESDTEVNVSSSSSSSSSYFSLKSLTSRSSLVIYLLIGAKSKARFIDWPVWRFLFRSRKMYLSLFNGILAFVLVNSCHHTWDESLIYSTTQTMQNSY